MDSRSQLELALFVSSKLPMRFFFHNILHIEHFEFGPILVTTYAIDYYQNRQYTQYDV